VAGPTIRVGARKAARRYHRKSDRDVELPHFAALLSHIATPFQVAADRRPW
jgi:hypothetical protein